MNEAKGWNEVTDNILRVWEAAAATRIAFIWLSGCVMEWMSEHWNQQVIKGSEWCAGVCY